MSKNSSNSSSSDQSSEEVKNLKWQLAQTEQKLERVNAKRELEWQQSNNWHGQAWKQSKGSWSSPQERGQHFQQQAQKPSDSKKPDKKRSSQELKVKEKKTEDHEVTVEPEGLKTEMLKINADAKTRKEAVLLEDARNLQDSKPMPSGRG